MVQRLRLNMVRGARCEVRRACECHLVERCGIRCGKMRCQDVSGERWGAVYSLGLIVCGVRGRVAGGRYEV
jgi:hypothetical protein